MSGKGNDAVAYADAGTANPELKATYFPNGMPAVLFSAGAQLMHVPGSPAFDDFTKGITFELLFYTHALTPGERTKVESYLKSRWATP